MKLMHLKLDNFQGLRSFEIDPFGQDIDIFGDNATGKTTVYNAFTWLLFDKPSTGAKNFTPKTRQGANELHNLEHTAEAVVQLDNGQEVTLRKTYHEVWQKKRGSAAEVLAGHTTDYYIDGVPMTEREYNYQLELLIAPAERMKMLTMPDYFAEAMEWADRRQLLLEICGDLSDADVLESVMELKPLQDILRKNSQGDLYSVDEYKKITQAQMTKINDDLKILPGRIDEAQRAIPDVSGLDMAGIEARLDSLERQKAALMAKRQEALSADVGEQEYRRQMQQLQDNLRQAELEYKEQTGQVRLSLQNELMELRSAYADKRADMQTVKLTLSTTDSKITNMEQLRIKLLAEYDTEVARRWDASTGICPTCHRPLPDNEVEALKSDFNKQRSERLEAINQRGITECSQDMIATAKEQAAELKQTLIALENDMKGIEAKSAVVKEQLDDIAVFEQTQTYSDLQMKITALKNAGADLQAVAAEITKGIDDDIMRVTVQMDNLMSDKSKFATAAVQRQRVAELQEMEKKLGTDYERLQGNLYLCEQFIRTKVRLLDERINSRFRSVRFRLFVEQQNGGLRECCDVLVPNEAGALVPYSVANNAGRINAGMEIIDTLGNHWGVSMPVFVDNAESVTRLKPINAQVIRLVVNEPDKILRVS